MSLFCRLVRWLSQPKHFFNICSNICQIKDPKWWMRELTSESCPLISTCIQWHVLEHTCKKVNVNYCKYITALWCLNILNSQCRLIKRDHWNIAFKGRPWIFIFLKFPKSKNQSPVNLLFNECLLKLQSPSLSFVFCRQK